MLDTLDLRYNLTKEQRNGIFSSVNENVKEMGQSNYLYCHVDTNRFKRYRTAAFYSMGILEVAVEDYWYPYHCGSSLCIKYKPALNMYKDKYALSREEDILKAAYVFKRLIDMINDKLCSGSLLDNNFLDWHVQRVDYAFNFPTQYYSEYMNLFRKRCREKEDRYRTESISYQKTKYHVNFYDKSVAFGEDSDSIHILRFEVQCYEDMLYSWKSRRKIRNLTVADIWDYSLAYNTVMKVLKRLSGTGDYYNYEQAAYLIMSDKKTSTVEKDMLCRLLDLSLSYRFADMWDVFLQTCCGQGDAEKVKKRLQKRLEKLNINGVIIPDDYQLSVLTNPVYVMDTMYGL